MDKNTLNNNKLNYYKLGFENQLFNSKNIIFELSESFFISVVLSILTTYQVNSNFIDYSGMFYNFEDNG